LGVCLQRELGWGAGKPPGAPRRMRSGWGGVSPGACFHLDDPKRLPGCGSAAAPLAPHPASFDPVCRAPGGCCWPSFWAMAANQAPRRALVRLWAAPPFPRRLGERFRGCAGAHRPPGGAARLAGSCRLRNQPAAAPEAPRRYSRAEVFAAVGLFERGPPLSRAARESFLMRRRRCDVFFITLKKSRVALFSPATRYNDYATSPREFPTGRAKSHPRSLIHRPALYPSPRVAVTARVLLLVAGGEQARLA